MFSAPINIRNRFPVKPMIDLSQLPHQVDETPHMPIPLPDGTILSARVWRPAGAGPVPAVLEFLPYRKRDGTAVRDALTHPYIAAHGYACVRVDMRGCGESEGLFDDEYSEQELTDGVDVVNWLAAQDWCSGSVGMVGISWGGFNGLQIAARHPAPLKAVISICSTVDRFADDIHYKGGIMLGENPGWAATALSWFSMPPDPEIVGDRWREMWLQRLEETPFLLKTWTAHQTRDAYWKHGSVCEDYSAIKAAVLSVGGWHDGYRNTISHLVANLSSPVKGLIGPWNHKYPHFGMPGPQIDFLGEMLRWWDHWLKGVDRGCDGDPDLRAYVMDSIAPAVSFDHRPGTWVAVDDWPVRTARQELHLAGEHLRAAPGDVARPVFTRLGCGQATGEYFPFGFGPGELPADQLADDALSTCFDSDPLPATRLLGAPRLSLRVASDQTCGQVAVRLCDLRPDGSSALIAHGFLNLKQRNGHDRSEPLQPGTPVDVDITLDNCGYDLPDGHRLRLAISASYWPFVWPEGVDVTLQITGGTLSLPVCGPGDTGACAFDPAITAPPMATTQVTPGQERKAIIHDIGAGEIRHEILGDGGTLRHDETGLCIAAKVAETFTIRPDDPGSATARFVWERGLSRGDWQTATRSVIAMRADADAFHLSMQLQADEGGNQVFEREWTATIPRA